MIKNNKEKLQDFCMPFEPLQPLLEKYQDPNNDNLVKIKQDLADIKTIMNQAFENVLGREEKLNELVNQSGDLSMWSKSLYDNAKQDDSCCSVQ